MKAVLMGEPLQLLGCLSSRTPELLAVVARYTILSYFKISMLWSDRQLLSDSLKVRAQCGLGRACCTVCVYRLAGEQAKHNH